MRSISIVQQNENSKPPEITKLIESLRGFLKKKSPKVGFLYQKRFFMVTEDAQKLVYFENDKSTSSPKGVLNIPDILDIRNVTNLEFEISFSDRKFSLSAESMNERDRWVEGINQLREFNIPDDKDFSRSKGVSVTHWKDLDKSIADQIQKEKELLVHQINNQKDSEINERILEVKKLKDYFNLIDEKVLSKRLMCGFLYKKGKINNVGLQFAGIGVKMKIPEKKRWCLLISNKSIDEDAETDQTILQNKYLPTWMNFNTIYYYSWDSNTDDSKPKGDIPLTECLEVIVDKATNFIFRINMGERIYSFNARTDMERQKWTKAIRLAIQNEKSEFSENKVSIDKAIDIFDSHSTPENQRVEDLKKYIEEEFKKLKIKPFADNENIEYLFLTRFDSILSELIEISTTAFSKTPPRTDILRFYINYMHVEKVTDEVNWYWSSNCKKLGNPDFLIVANFLLKYHKKASKYFIDERFEESIKTLVEIYFSAITDSVLDILPNIVLNISKSEGEISNTGLITVNLPVDLFKILNETIDIASSTLPHPEVQKRFSKFAVIFITHSQYHIGKLMEETILDSRQLIGICNDTVSLIKNGKILGEKIGFDEKIGGLGRNWVKIGAVSKDKLLSILFRNISFFFKLEYEKIEVVSICEEIIAHFKTTISLIHDSYYRKVWQGLLEVVIIEYLKSLLLCCKKCDMKPDSLLLKLENDIMNVKKLFGELIFANVVKEMMKPLNQIYRLLSCQFYLSLLEHIERLHKILKWNNKSYKYLVSFRKDLPSSLRSEVIDQIPLILKQEDNDEGKDEFNLDQLLHEKHSDEEDDQEEEELSSKESVSSSSTSSSESEDEEETNNKGKNGDETKKKGKELNVFKGEGYLLKKPPNEFKIFWEKRYYRYRNGILYWYKDQNSNQAQNKINLVEVEDVYEHPGNPKVFMIQMPDRLFTLQSEKHSTRNDWVAFLKTETSKLQNKAVNEEPEEKIIEPILLKSRNLPLIITPFVVTREKAKKKIYEAPERKKTICIDFSIEENQEEVKKREDSISTKFRNLFK